MNFKLRQQRMQQNGDAIVGQDQSIQPVPVHLLRHRNRKLFQFFFRIKPVVHGVDGTDAAYSSIRGTQKFCTVHHVQSTFLFCVCRVHFTSVFSVEKEPHMGQHFFIGQFAVHMVNILFAFFRFLQKPFRVCAVVRKGIDSSFGVHVFLTFL